MDVPCYIKDASSPLYDSDTTMKRHGVYFPPEFDLAKEILKQEMSTKALKEFEDNGTSSYMFRSPRTVKKDNSDIPEVVTPAQEYINQYRAGKVTSVVEAAPTATVSPATTTSTPSTTLRDPETSDEATWIESVDDDGNRDESVSVSCNLTLPKIRFRQSRFDALAPLRAEAYEEMERMQVNEHHALVCPRTGCRETVANVHALTYHLHLHDIERQKYQCNDCKAYFKHRSERKSHACVGSSRSSATSPLYATFGTILSKIKSRS